MSKDVLKNLLGMLYSYIPESAICQGIADARLRVGYKLAVKTIYNKTLYSEYSITDSDIDYVVNRATDNSRFAYEDELERGYLYAECGVRIGVGGNYVLIKDKLTLKKITSIVIRIPHQILGSADKFSDIIADFDSTLIVSPPSGGKTTLLRDFIRRLSYTNNILAIDERYELSGGNIAGFDFGWGVDFVCGIPKQIVLENVIRSMSPDIVALDELFGEKDAFGVEECVCSGVKILATIHADDTESASFRLKNAIKIFKNIIVLNSTPHIGSIKSIIRRELG